MKRKKSTPTTPGTCGQSKINKDGKCTCRLMNKECIISYYLDQRRGTCIIDALKEPKKECIVNRYPEIEGMCIKDMLDDFIQSGFMPQGGTEQ